MQAATNAIHPKPTLTIRGALVFFVLASTAILVRTPRLLRPKSYLIAAASIITGGATISWLAPNTSDPRSNLRRLTASAAGAAIALPLVLPAPQRAILLTEPPALALIVAALTAHLSWAVVRLLGNGNLAAQPFQRRTETILSEFIPPVVARFAAAEIMALRYVLAFRAPPSYPAGAKAFTCHRGGVLALVWTVVALSFIEVGLVHLVLRQWSETVAILVSLLSELSVVYLMGLANSLRCLPTHVSEDGVQVRLGILIDQHIRWDEIAKLATISGAYRKSPTVLRAAVISAPNVRLTLKTGKLVGRLFRRDQCVNSVELYLDDAADFVRAARSLARPAAV